MISPFSWAVFAGRIAMVGARDARGVALSARAIEAFEAALRIGAWKTSGGRPPAVRGRRLVGAWTTRAARRRRRRAKGAGTKTVKSQIPGGEGRGARLVEYASFARSVTFGPRHVRRRSVWFSHVRFRFRICHAQVRPCGKGPPAPAGLRVALVTKEPQPPGRDAWAFRLPQPGRFRIPVPGRPWEGKALRLPRACERRPWVGKVLVHFGPAWSWHQLGPVWSSLVLRERRPGSATLAGQASFRRTVSGPQVRRRHGHAEDA